MKNLIFLLLCVCSISMAAQWVQIDSIHFGNQICMEFTDADTGFIYNEPGKLRQTTDGGASWDTMIVPFTGYIFDIEFATAQIGYAAGGSYFPAGSNYAHALLKTTDGGTSWDSLHGNYTHGVIHNLEIIDENQFYMIGGGHLLYSDDGGHSMDTITVSAASNQVYLKLISLSPNRLFVLSSNHNQAGQVQVMIHQSVDGGLNWNNIFLETGSGLSPDFEVSPDGKIWVIHSVGSIAYTSDTGASWQKINLPHSTLLLNEISFVHGSLYATAVDSTGYSLYFSADNGFTFQKQFGFNSNNKYIVDTDFPTAEVGYFISNQELYKNDGLVSIMHNHDQKKVSLYPNPVSDQLYLEVPSMENLEITIYDVQGRRVFQQKLSGKLKYKINPLLMPGTYYMEWQHLGFRDFSSVVKL